MDEPSSWVDRARATITCIAASHGHKLEWTADEPRRPGSRLGRYWRADCQSCPVPKAGRALVLPVDASESEDHWLGGPEELIPAYLTRKCRQTREPLTRGPASKYWTRTHREKQTARLAEFKRKRAARARLWSQLD